MYKKQAEKCIQLYRRQASKIYTMPCGRLAGMAGWRCHNSVAVLLAGTAGCSVGYPGSTLAGLAGTMAAEWSAAAA